MNLAIPVAVSLLFASLLWVWIRYSAKQTINPRNLCVIDGDTVWTIGPDRSVSEKVRLQNVNAPELRRPRSRRELNRAVAATEFLRDRVERARSATIRRKGKDRYGRTELSQTRQ
jgi:endonuclease YncB( thermonuclease family)